MLLLRGSLPVGGPVIPSLAVFSQVTACPQQPAQGKLHRMATDAFLLVFWIAHGNEMLRNFPRKQLPSSIVTLRSGYEACETKACAIPLNLVDSIGVLSFRSNARAAVVFIVTIIKSIHASDYAAELPTSLPCASPCHRLRDCL